MRIGSLVVYLFLATACAFGQFRPVNFHSVSESSYLTGSQKPAHLNGWRSDQQTHSWYVSPRQTISPVSPNGFFWLGSTATQSFNSGKFGTIYYYDMIGNMLYARTFIDIAGKNRRGLKLMLPTLNQRMFIQR